MRKKLVLFDIDGTLVKRCSSSASLHTDALVHAFKAVFGIDVKLGASTIKLSGMTDRAIVFTLGEMDGLKRNEILAKIDDVFAATIKYFLEGIDDDHTFSLIPGVLPLIHDLKEKGHTLGLLTGNLEPIAEAKLKKFSIFQFFQVGAFGNVTEIRHHLVEIAKGKMSLIGMSFENEDIVVIGDTPRDVDCGKNACVRTIAVATGDFSFEELKECKPDFLFNSLSDTNSIISAIESA